VLILLIVFFTWVLSLIVMHSHNAFGLPNSHSGSGLYFFNRKLKCMFILAIPFTHKGSPSDLLFLDQDASTVMVLAGCLRRHLL